MKNFALVSEGLVKDLFVADEARVLELMFPDHLIVEETEATGIVFIGGTYSEGVFAPPSFEETAEELPAE
jgi:hypothetical protein